MDSTSDMDDDNQSITKEAPKKEKSVESVENEEEEQELKKSPFERTYETPKVTSTEMINKIMTQDNLFKTKYSSDSFVDFVPDEKTEKLASILVTGFGLKSLKQLQEALEAQRALQVKEREAEQYPCICSEESSEKSEILPAPMVPLYSIEERVRYLLQLEKYIEYEGEMGSIPTPVREGTLASSVEPPLESLPPIDRAKRYLKDHKIFQFFQFLISHLLSAVPEDPINYLMSLLDRVLLYRAGLVSPPLLYERKHIEQLFHLMDRFGNGYVDMQQYKTAMETFGICFYNKTPFLNQLSMVPREVFIEEIFCAESAMFNELIKSRVPCSCDLTAPPPTVIDLDLRTQSSFSIDESLMSNVEFNPVASVEKFWEKHGDHPPKIFKGKFWSEFVREAQRRDSVRRESQQSDIKDGK